MYQEEGTETVQFEYGLGDGISAPSPTVLGDVDAIHNLLPFTLRLGLPELTPR